MNYSHIDLVLEIAHAGSISAAAENLYISQPSLSATLKSIESEIGTPLFKRSKSGVELTPFGKKYISYAQDISNQIYALNNLYKSQQIASLDLSVVTEGFRFMHQALYSIRQKFIGTSCTFRINEAPVEKQIQHVKNGDFEIGVLSLLDSQRKSFLRDVRANGLEYFRLQEATPGIYVSKFSKTFPSSITHIDQAALHLLMDMPLVSLHRSSNETNGHRIQPIFASILRRYNLNPRNPIITNNSGTKTDMITLYDGYGEATYCASLYDRFPFYDNLRFIPFAPELAQHAELGWIQRQNHPRSPLANELIQLLSE